MKIFVTGHLGTIGKDLLPLLSGHEVIGYDKADGYDIEEINKLRDAMPRGVDLIFHLANIPHPDRQIPPEVYRHDNVEKCRILLDVAKEKKAKGFVFFSSLAAIGFDAPFSYESGVCWGDEIYPVGEPPYDEDTELLPEDYNIEPYGVSKVIQEKMIGASGIPYMIFRFGPYGSHTSVTDMNDNWKYRNYALSRNFLGQVVGGVLKNGLSNEVIHVCPVGMWGGEKLQKWFNTPTVNKITLKRRK